MIFPSINSGTYLLLTLLFRYFFYLYARLVNISFHTYRKICLELSLFYSQLPHDYICTKYDCCTWYINDNDNCNIICVKYRPSYVDTLFEQVRIRFKNTIFLTANYLVYDIFYLKSRIIYLSVHILCDKR